MTARANPKRRRQMVGSVALIVVLAALFGAGFTPPAPIHRLQAGYLEGRHDWERALAEYQLAGESAPGSHDLARVTTEWGEQLSAAGQYQTAITRFEQVITWYGGAAAEVMRAKSDEIAAYFAWGKQAIDEHNYAAATNHYDALLMLTFCDADCTTKASALDATAYYMLAEAELAAQHYAAAVDTFIVLTTRFASSPEAQKAHADFAKALLGKGKQQLSTSTCAEATKTYENLANNFADTPEGMEAAQDLMSGPQPVKGRFTGGVPPNAVPFVFLIHEENHPGKDQTVQAGRDGSFSFSSVVPGVYDILLGSYNGNSLTISFPTDIPTATIGLCPYDFGDLPDAFPTPGFFPAQVSAASLGLTADSTSLDAPADTFAAAPSSVAVLPGQEFMWRPARRKDIAHSPTSY